MGMNLNSLKILFVGLVALCLSGCSQVASLRQYRQNWLGHPIGDLKTAASRPSVVDKYKRTIGWTETTYKLDNGNSVWVEVAWKECFIHWEVNPEGTIVGSKIEGSGCKWH